MVSSQNGISLSHQSRRHLTYTYTNFSPLVASALQGLKPDFFDNLRPSSPLILRSGRTNVPLRSIPWSPLKALTPMEENGKIRWVCLFAAADQNWAPTCLHQFKRRQEQYLDSRQWINKYLQFYLRFENISYCRKRRRKSTLSSARL